MTIKAWLEGSQIDLQDLSELPPSRVAKVVREGNDYYLTSSEIDNPPEGTEYYEVAARLIVLIIGLGRGVKNPSLKPVSLSGKYTDGTTDHLVVAEEIPIRDSATFVLTTSDGTVVPDEPSPVPDYLALAAKNPKVDRVLKITGRGENLDWDALWKVYEIIEKALGEKEIRQNGWATNTQLTAFGASANNFKVSGDAARHAVDKGTDYPKHTMTIEEGRQFIRHVLEKWLTSLAGNPNCDDAKDTTLPAAGRLIASSAARP